MSETFHYSVELHALADGRLDEAQVRAVEAHLATCDACRAELAAIRAVTRAARRVPVETVPDELAFEVRQLLDAEDQSRALVQPLRPSAVFPATAAPTATTPEGRRDFLRWATAAGVVVALGGAAWIARLAWGSNLVDEVEDEYRRYLVGALRLDIAETEPAALEKRFSEQGVLFTTRVFDFGMMEYKLVGGTVHRAGDRQSAMFGYRGPTGEDVLCQMFTGTTDAVSDTRDIRENDGIRFFIHQREGVTIVFWQEGDVVCALASGALPDTVIQLAFAKAMKV